MAEENTEQDNEIEDSGEGNNSEIPDVSDEMTSTEETGDVNSVESENESDTSNVPEPTNESSVGNDIPVVEPTKVTSADGSEIEGPITDISMLLDIPVTLSMEIGQTKISINELLKLGKDSVIELQRMAHEPLDVLVNGTLVAHGEAVVVGDRFGIRLIDVISPQDRLRNFS